MSAPGWLNFTSPGHGLIMQNHVYRNVVFLGSIQESNEIVREVNPDLILPGHGDAFRATDVFYSDIAKYAEGFERAHKRIMALEENDTHFGVDSRAAYLEPYRVRLDSSAQISLTAHVRNPYNRKVSMSARLVGPAGWDSSSIEFTIEPRSESTAAVAITPPGTTVCRRQPIALELITSDCVFGQVAETLVTIGFPDF